MRLFFGEGADLESHINGQCKYEPAHEIMVLIT